MNRRIGLRPLAWLECLAHVLLIVLAMVSLGRWLCRRRARPP